MATPLLRNLLATTAICLAAVGLNSCQKTMQVDSTTFSSMKMENYT